ncbi:amidohydrolase [Chitinophaga sp. Cy-1792]|uniref:amidohydrolase family protein n=1 Tax=Chitinophaga sp. Cy-1792 TaxID=2608339 RepID=UPI0014204999|nr:amidohydrolase family protein [Chitinophaga sp. Cy-1792]NIG55326.1 amidohydrolase family protein [Chitinophaga sp. Cy-1792]
MKIVDTHLHIWDLSRAAYPWLENDTSILNRTWCIAELEHARAAAGVTHGMLVQASGCREDTELMMETARNTPWINGVVAWLPLTDTRQTQELLETTYLQEPYFKGVRHQVHDEDDTRWLLQPAVINSLKFLARHGIPYDFVGVLPEHLETALEVAERVPDLRMVFDHLNQPPISTGETFGRWGTLMKAAARHPNFYAKISGLGTASGNFAGRTADHISPYVAYVLEHFGAGRCFCGGDWPVSMLADDYAGTWQTITHILGRLCNEADQEKILYDNACRFYNLSTL